MNKNKNGFTLVELVIVIAIIAIMVAILIPTFAGIIERAKENVRMQQAKLAIKSFYSEDESKTTFADMKNYVIEVDGNFYIVNDNDISKLPNVNSLEDIDLEFTYSDGNKTNINGVSIYEPTTDFNGYFYVELDEENHTATLLEYCGTSTKVTIPKFVSGINREKVSYEFNPSYCATEIYYSGEIEEDQTLLIYVSDDGVNYEYISQVSSMYELDNLFWGEGMLYQYEYSKIEYYVDTAIIGDSGYLVTKLDKTFRYNETVKSVILPNTLVEIGVETFYYSAVENVNIPTNLITIGENAFTASKIKSISLNSNLEVIEGNAFNYTKFESIEIPDSVNFIGNYAFSNANITSVKLPSGLTTISNNLFYNCKELRSITMPSNLSSIGSNSFYGCSSLLSITIPSSVVSIGQNAFSNTYRLIEVYNLSTHIDLNVNSSLYTNTSLTATDIYSSLDIVSKIKTFENSNLSYYEIETDKYSVIGFDYGITEPKFIDKCVEIGKYAFYNSIITNITIPNSVTSLKDNCFRSCSKLSSVVIPNTISTIPQYAFAYSGITQITIPNSVTSLKDYCFYNCNKLENAVLTSNITTIPQYAFYGNNSLKNINISLSSIETFEKYAFYQCYALELGDIIFTDSCKSIGMSAFESCYGITSVTINDPDITLGNIAFAYCNEIESLTLCEGIESVPSDFMHGCSSLSTINFPSTFKRFGNGSFAYTAITELTLPSLVTEIETNTFVGCRSLATVTLHNNLSTIGRYAFWQCSSLTEITIPSSVTTIGANAFYQCSSLTRVIFNTTTGWRASASYATYNLQSSALANPNTAATYITTPYPNHVDQTWTRS